jgi:hypothetical protein
MKTWSDLLSKGEALAKQVSTQAAALAEKAKQEEWVKQVASAVSEVWFSAHYFHQRCRQPRQ